MSEAASAELVSLSRVLQLQCVQPWLERGNGFERAASLFAIAVMVEGCSVYIKDK